MRWKGRANECYSHFDKKNNRIGFGLTLSLCDALALLYTRRGGGQSRGIRRSKRCALLKGPVSGPRETF